MKVEVLGFRMDLKKADWRAPESDEGWACHEGTSMVDLKDDAKAACSAYVMAATRVFEKVE